MPCRGSDTDDQLIRLGPGDANEGELSDNLFYPGDHPLPGDFCAFPCDTLRAWQRCRDWQVSMAPESPVSLRSIHPLPLVLPYRASEDGAVSQARWPIRTAIPQIFHFQY